VPEETTPLARAGEALLVVLLVVLPGVLVAVLSFRSGSYFPSPTALTAVGLLLVLALLAAVSRRPLAGFGVPLVVTASALALFTAWTRISSSWSDSPARALLEYDRALLYLVALLLGGALGRTPLRLRWMIRVIAAGLVVVCACALVTRLLPDVWPIDPITANARLNYPLTYWNSLALLAALGLVLCLGLTCDDREARAGRVLSAAALPVLAVTLLLTFSRGAIGVAILGVATLLVAGRPRALVGGLLVAVPTVWFALRAAYRADLFAGANPAGAAAAAQGQRVAVVVVACVVLAALGRIALLAIDPRLAALRAPAVFGRPRVKWGMTATTVLVAIGLAFALSLPAALQRQYAGFIDGAAVDADADRRVRLTIPDNNGRVEQWRIALGGFRENPFHGDGAGTFALRWQHERPRLGELRDAHSLYAEVLGELGIVGLALVVVALAGILGGFFALARGPDRVLGGALLGAGVAWAVHAGVEWHWEMPAVTAWLFGAGGMALARPVVAGRLAQAPRSVVKGYALRAIVVLGCAALMFGPLQVHRSSGPLRDSQRAFAAGDCPRAIDRARRATALVEIRPEPYVIAGYCEARVGRPRRAVRTFGQALRWDPGNWEVHYGLGLVRAAAGLDPRPQLRIADRLNPLDPLPPAALATFDTDSPRTWRRRAAKVPMP